jgi:AbrB family looped-hinge helix DNA binding protein
VLGGTGLISQTRSGTTSYFLQDGQGSTRALTNGSGGVSGLCFYAVKSIIILRIKLSIRKGKTTMDTVTISEKYQMVIPRAIREKWKIKPGQKVRLIVYGNVLEVVPVRNIKEARGFLKGMSSTIEREETDRV